MTSTAHPGDYHVWAGVERYVEEEIEGKFVGRKVPIPPLEVAGGDSPKVTPTTSPPDISSSYLVVLFRVGSTTMGVPTW